MVWLAVLEPSHTFAVVSDRVSKTSSLHHGLDALSVPSSGHSIKLIPCLFESSPPKRSVQRLFYQIYMVELFWRWWLWLVFCDLENGSRIYFYDYFVQRTTLKLQLWGLCLIWLLVHLLCFISFQLQFHLFLHVFLILSCLFHFSCLLFSVSFQFSFKTLEIFPC